MERQTRKSEEIKEVGVAINEEIINSIKNNVKKMGYEYEALQEKEKKHLIKIEKAVIETFKLEKQAKEMLSRNVVSVKGISSKAKIARQTLYNNPILKEYIDYRAESFAKIDASRKSSTKDEEIRKLRDEITTLHKRDVELEETKREMKELKRKLQEKDERIKMLKKDLIRMH